MYYNFSQLVLLELRTIGIVSIAAPTVLILIFIVVWVNVLHTRSYDVLAWSLNNRTFDSKHIIRLAP